MNEALRRMYIACKNRSGFPGRMPAGSDGEDDNVSVPAILEGLGLIPTPGEENLLYDSFGATHSVWRVTDISKSTTPSQATEDMVPSMAKEHELTSRRPQCKVSHDQVATFPNMGLAVRQDEYHGGTTKLAYHQLDSRADYPSHPIDFYQRVANDPQNCQTSIYQGGLDSVNPSWQGSTTVPPLRSYDFSYAY
jgi:hypothetical protein